MSRKRVFLYACLALAVPLPALALEGGSGPASLDVQASLNQCGIGDGAIECSLDASFNRLEDAEYYTASVTAPDGSVSDLGTVAEGGGEGRAAATLSVGFSGNGEYTVTISAWGYDEEGRPDRLGSDDSGTEGDDEQSGKGEVETVVPPADQAPEPDAEEPVPGEEQPPVTEEEPPECPELEPPAPSDGEPPVDQPPEPLPSICEEPEPGQPPEPDPDQQPGEQQPEELQPGEQPAPPQSITP